MYTKALGLIAAGLLLATTTQAATFRWAFQGDVQLLDPYSLNETLQLGFLSNVYEGLVLRDKDLDIVPALATAWKVVEPTVWRFELREDVTFHNGNPFTADKVNLLAQPKSKYFAKILSFDTRFLPSGLDTVDLRRPQRALQPDRLPRRLGQGQVQPGRLLQPAGRRTHRNVFDLRYVVVK